jgi:hypothetical protein
VSDKKDIKIMFVEADILMDEHFRPIFVINEKLNDGEVVLELFENKIIFKQSDTQIGQLDNMEEDFMFLVSEQDVIGIIAHEKGTEEPDQYTHTATVKELIQ